MNDKRQPDTEAQELDEQALDQASGGASNSTSQKAPAKPGNKIWQDDWLDPK